MSQHLSEKIQPDGKDSMPQGDYAPPQTKVNIVDTSSSQTFTGNVITQAIHCDSIPLEVTSSGEMLSDNFQPSIPLVLSAETTDQATTAKSPRLSLPLSLNNTVIDLQQLQAFLMTLQPQLNQTAGANFESSASADDTSTLTAFQGSLHCNIEGEATEENDTSASVSTGLMTINEPFTNRPLESFDPLGKSNEEIVLTPQTNEKLQAEMIAVQVLSQTVSSNAMNTSRSAETENSVKTSMDTTDVVSLLQEQLSAGTQMYSLQISGQTIPFTTIQLPMLQQTEHHQSASTSAETPVLQQLTGDISQNISTLGASSSQLGLTCPPEKERPSFAEEPHTNGKDKYTCEICGKVYLRQWSYYGHMREHAAGDKQHSCEVCNKQFQNVNNLKQHMLIHTGIKPFKCDLCEKAFSNANSLRIHALSHSEMKPYVCDVEGCDKGFSNPSSLRVHQRVHQTEKPFKCSVAGCTLAFKTSSELSRHSFRHSGAKPHKCDTCGKSFVRYDDLKRHFYIHTGIKQFKCDQCDFACIQSFDLVKHKYTHGGEKPYKCQHCDKQFTRPARLKEHQRQHTGEKPYKCDQCPKAFTQRTSLKSHILSHSGSKPFKCHLCSKSYTTATDLRSHINNHTGKRPYSCLVCGKEFISSKTLKRHAIVHTGEKPYECDRCDRRFARASDLKVHMPVHSEDKPYKCDKCEKMFTRLSTLKEHSRIHTGDFPFKCEYCEKIFNHRSHLNVHIRTHTGEKPYKCDTCGKEFARKSSLRYHARIHLDGPSRDCGTSVKSGLIEVELEDYSSAGSLENHAVEIDVINPDGEFSSTTENPSSSRKRKRDDLFSEEEKQFLSKKMAFEQDVSTVTNNLV